MKQKGEKERKEKEEDYSISKPSSGRKVHIIIMSKNLLNIKNFNELTADSEEWNMHTCPPQTTRNINFTHFLWV